MLDDDTDNGGMRGASRAARSRPVGGSEAKRERTPEGGGDAHELGTSRTVFPDHESATAARKLADLQDWRRIRYARRQSSAEILVAGARFEAGLDPDDLAAKAGESGWVRPPRPARCRWACAANVGVHSGDTGGHWSGIEHCSSIWACPVCAAVIRAKRATEIQQAVENWQGDQGGSLVFVTLTLRHKLDDPLNMTLDAAMTAWRKLLQGRAWKSFTERFGIEGYIRAVEVTLSGENGWHPHIHVLFFTRKPLSESDLAAWESLMFGRWADLVTKAGARMPTKLRGIDVRAADRNGKVVAQYLSKLQDVGGTKPEAKRTKIATELARFDTKGGRSGSITPFELLDASMGEDDWDDVARARLWWEYYQATRGRRAITWSHGLRDMCGIEPEKSDEQVMEEDAVRERLVMLIAAATYRRKIRDDPGVMGAILDAVERDEWGIALALSGGELVYDEVTGELGIEPPRRDAG